MDALVQTSIIGRQVHSILLLARGRESQRSSLCPQYSGFIFNERLKVSSDNSNCLRIVNQKLTLLTTIVAELLKAEKPSVEVVSIITWRSIFIEVIGTDLESKLHWCNPSIRANECCRLVQRNYRKNPITLGRQDSSKFMWQA